MAVPKTILLKKEAVYGTDAVPTPAANAVVTRGFTAKPIEVDTLARELDLPSRGRTRSANTGRRATFGFELDLAGSGDAGTAAPFMEILQACGMAAPTLLADTHAEQKFAAVGAALSSLSAYHWTGVERARAFGVRGSFGLNFTVSRYPFMTFNGIGLLPASPVVDATAPGAAADYARWLEPVEVSTANTEFLLDGFALALQSFTLEDGANLAYTALVGENYVSRGNHALTGRIRGKAPALGSKNFYTALDIGDEVPLSLVHGTEAGNILELESDYLQITNIDRAEENDELFVDIGFGLNINSGSDDLLIRAK
jgi:hypothetical protein